MRTHTKTFTIYDPWAESVVRCERRPGGDERPRAYHGDPCAEPQCDEPLVGGEVAYKVTQLPDDDYVCWRHVRPDDGPIKIPCPPAASQEREGTG